MKLYEVTNGHMGYSYLRCQVVAANEERAKELGSMAFKEDAKNERYEYELEHYAEIYERMGKQAEKYNYPEEYWTELEVYCLFDDLTVEAYNKVGD